MVTFVTLKRKGKVMTKREIMRKLKAEQKALMRQLENDVNVANPNYRKGRRSYSEIFNGIDRHRKLI